MFPETLETPRLRLTALTAETVDVRTLHDALFTVDRERVEDELRWLPWEPHRTLKETHEYVAECSQQWAERDRATYVIRLGPGFDDEGDIVGLTYLDCFWPRRTGEMVMWTRRAYWNQGFMTEYGRAIYDLAFCELDLDLMIADAIDGNDRGYTIFTHMTEVFDGQYDGVLRNRLPDGDVVHDVHRFSITQPQYLVAMGYEAAEELEHGPDADPERADRIDVTPKTPTAN
ncbi:GNAT family N-acetyltransferase [Haloarchaeobius sp. DFWS5]|uniref:GNAT family N-acetyltransferase n=1 Tax=Haloarchaeobius sp. DFWS5 TaxID=3446114 RepID=UPI003EB9B90C